jgi:hypothetical protein
LGSPSTLLLLLPVAMVHENKNDAKSLCSA